MQIDIINQRVDSLVRTLGLDVKTICVARFWQTDKVIDKNEWEICRYLFIKKLNYNEIRAMNNYYSNIMSVMKQQDEIKQIILEGCKHYAVSEHKSIIDSSGIRIPTLLIETIGGQCNKLVEGRTAIPYERLKEIANM